MAVSERRVFPWALRRELLSRSGEIPVLASTMRFIAAATVVGVAGLFLSAPFVVRHGYLLFF